ncbi:helix-turn-helix transcriptional regulator [Longispora albida]|uniref:helix-turn-helix transcriptional regulator n=1 Tax=Longispora albida TaxID=203523 RepID=UPI00036C0A02|nr:helix-turn-helix domain-containing protein [Longispora albida]
MISDTVSGLLARVVLHAAWLYGVEAAEFGRLPGLTAPALSATGPDSGLVRVPAASMTRRWSLVQHPAPPRHQQLAEESMDSPLPGADPHMAAMLRRYAELASLTARLAPCWLEKFRCELLAALSSGDCTLDSVARRLTVSGRSMQRRLAEKGTNWRSELEAARCEQAAGLLRGTDLSTEAIAARTGYSDARALRRAFRRRMGRTPAEFRRER